jgi:hypothetical protein
MKQGNGSEILGANNPRSAEIGIIHVSPTDDRQSVLAAILTQERLGRKQVAVVLPEQNKAFRHPIDFEGLKNKRRELQAQIIFVAPGGPGPADFARQRRFPVYSSLENYAKSLQDDAVAVQDQGSKSPRPGWLFGRKQKQATSDVASLSSAPAQPSPVVLQPFDAGAAPDAGTEPAEVSPAPMSTASFGDDTLSLNHDEMVMPASQSNEALTPFADEEDDLDLPPPPIIPVPVVEPDPGTATQPAANNADLVSAGSGIEPNIIELSPRRTGNTGKMPIPAAQPDPQPINLSAKPRNSGKMAAVGTAATAAAAAGAFSAKKASSAAVIDASQDAVVMAQTARGGSPIPPRSGTGRPGGPGGPGGLARGNMGRNWLIGAGLLLLTLLLVFGGIAYAAPGMLSHFSNIVPAGPLSSTATVTIVPATKTLKNTYVITAVTGKPDASQRQVQARILSANLSQSQTVTATGRKQTPGARATGSLTFYNGSTSSFTVAAGTLFTARGGVQVVNDVAASIPAANPPNFGTVTVPAHAVNVGSAGNIPAYAISGTCCAPGNYITVKNLSAFSGGQDPQNYTFLQQSDIDAVATPLQQRLTASAQANIKGQQRAGEQFVNAKNPISCNSTVTANPPVGSKTASATMTVQVSCSGEVYDQQAAETMAADLYKSDSTINPGPGFVLSGNVSTNLTQANVVDNKGTVSLLVTVQGTWVYQTSQIVAQEKSWAQQIAGKSKQQATAFLQSQPGVGQMNIQYSSNTLPTDPTQITFVVQNVPISTSPTPGGSGPSPVPGTPSSGTPTPTPTSQNGLGSK